MFAHVVGAGIFMAKTHRQMVAYYDISRLAIQYWVTIVIKGINKFIT